MVRFAKSQIDHLGLTRHVLDALMSGLMKTRSGNGYIHARVWVNFRGPEK